MEKERKKERQERERQEKRRARDQTAVKWARFFLAGNDADVTPFVRLCNHTCASFTQTRLKIPQLPPFLCPCTSK